MKQMFITILAVLFLLVGCAGAGRIDDVARGVPASGGRIDDVARGVPVGGGHGDDLLQPPPAQADEAAQTAREFVQLQTESNTAIATTVTKMRSEEGLLARRDKAELDKLAKDLVCLHVESVVNDGKLPSDDDYGYFIFDRGISQFVSIWELKAKAESVEKFAEKALQARSSAEVRARAQLLAECNFR